MLQAQGTKARRGGLGAHQNALAHLTPCCAYAACCNLSGRPRGHVPERLRYVCSLLLGVCLLLIPVKGLGVIENGLALFAGEFWNDIEFTLELHADPGFFYF